MLIALARFGGLRVPSELAGLTWADVHWSRARFRVESPKTGGRWVPVFPELAPHLAAAFDAAPPGSVHVAPRVRDKGVNLRTGFERIISAGPGNHPGRGCGTT